MAAALSVALFTSGCAGIGAVTSPRPAMTPGPVILADAVELTPPRGLCVSPSASRLTRGFAMMGACSPGQGDPVVLSVQLGGAGSAVVKDDAAALATFLETEAGRRTLSPTGAASAVTVTSTKVGGGQVRVLYTRHPEGDEWRGFTDVGGRLATVSLRATEPDGISAARGDHLLKRALGGLRPVPGTR